MKPYFRVLLSSAVFALLFICMGIVAAVMIGGTGAIGRFADLASQPSGIAIAVVAALVVAAHAHYNNIPWATLSKAAAKLPGANCDEMDEEQLAAVLEGAAAKLRAAEEELATIRQEGKDWEEKSKYLAQTESALMNILEDVEDANKKLKELDQLKTDFLNVTSHELRTPLTPLIAYIDMMEKQRLGSLTDEQKQALSVMRRNASRLKLLITDILDIAKLEGRRMKYAMEPQNFNKLVLAAAADQLSNAKERNIRIATDIGRKLPKIKADGSRMMQVLTNIINNAIKFSKDGSEIRVVAKETGGEVVVSVQDSGMGIPAEDIPKLFNMFYQSRRTMTRNAEGTGLGLAICKWIVEDHGGRIWASSKVGEGSVFSFALPKKFAPRTANIVGLRGETAVLEEVKKSSSEKGGT